MRAVISHNLLEIPTRFLGTFKKYIYLCKVIISTAYV